MAAAVYQGQLKLELLREAFRRELRSGVPAAADEKVTSPQESTGSCGTGEQAGGSERRCFEVSPNQDGCSLGSFLASFGVVRPDDVSSPAPSAQEDVSRGSLQTSHRTRTEAFWALPGAAMKRKRVRGALFRQLSREETAALFDLGFESEFERGAPEYSAEMYYVGCSLCAEGGTCEGHAKNKSLTPNAEDDCRNGFVPLPPVLEGSLEGEDGLQLEQCEQVTDSCLECFSWEPEEILDAELTLGRGNAFEGMEGVCGRRYDLPVLMMGLRARLHTKVPHDEGPPAARRKRERYGKW
eukprot:TRINITY_DN18887_c0_g1_i1.p1 TRINITY_DN18887_c0_g1~~TRINITY_DN18887_c0_g1_i1.p1  ORF type:complete len:297 (+),score=32.40 TRINITY_DN18887_c0_g1_i1:486-1376(+)